MMIDIVQNERLISKKSKRYLDKTILKQHIRSPKKCYMSHLEIYLFALGDMHLKTKASLPFQGVYNIKIFLSKKEKQEPNWLQEVIMFDLLKKTRMDIVQKQLWFLKPIQKDIYLYL